VNVYRCTMSKHSGNESPGQEGGHGERAWVHRRTISDYLGND
jgi:hypothetical protein